MPGTLGNLAQTFFTGPSFFNLDASLAKDFRISERFRLNLRTDWINATNHEDFANTTIDSSINSATFGRVTAKGAPLGTTTASSYSAPASTSEAASAALIGHGPLPTRRSNAIAKGAPSHFPFDN